MTELNSYDLIIAASVVLILSFLFGEISKRTSVPSVLMLIFLGIFMRYLMQMLGFPTDELQGYLELLGKTGLILIVLEAALELKLTPDNLPSIGRAFLIALIGLLVSGFAAAWILQDYYEMDFLTALIYAVPLSILSSAIIIPSVSGLVKWKKEFHIYESTFSDILGIMVFYFLIGRAEDHGGGNGFGAFFGNFFITVIISIVASYLLLILFQRIKSNTKLFLLIAVLFLLYAIGAKAHLSSLIMILTFGLLMANRDVFFKGPLARFLDRDAAAQIYEGLHVVTLESSFVIRTFFFVIFGMSISLTELANFNVVTVGLMILISIYVIRYIILRLFEGKDIMPQVFIAPRGLITILLLLSIPVALQDERFDEGILLAVILGTSIIMAIAMIYNKKRITTSLRKIKNNPVGYTEWKLPTVSDQNSSSSGH